MDVRKWRSGLDWNTIDTAPKGVDVLVWYDHDADPYQDPNNPNRLTNYAAWADGGDWLDGKGVCIAKWFPKEFESEDEYGNGYWKPAAWFAKEDNDYMRVCNPIYWLMIIPTSIPHNLYKTEDEDAPDNIRDRNGSVALDLCRYCGRGEAELSESCDIIIDR